MSDTKFYYFDIRGRGEYVRLVFAAAGETFEDIRIPFSEWPDKRSESPYGQLPYMEYKGKVYGQSYAIANFFAREFGLYGKTNLDALRIDQAVQLAEDLRAPNLIEFSREKDETKKAELKQKLKDEVFPMFLGFFESLLIDNGSTGFFVRNTVTLADLVVYDILDTVLGIDPEAIAAYPNAKRLRSNVEAVPTVKCYLDSRPKSTI